MHHKPILPFPTGGFAVACKGLKEESALHEKPVKGRIPHFFLNSYNLEPYLKPEAHMHDMSSQGADIGILANPIPALPFPITNHAEPPLMVQGLGFFGYGGLGL